MRAAQWVMVTGGRAYSDRGKLEATLNATHAARSIALLIEGGANGADRLARAWAMAVGIPVVTMHAHWDRIGRGAGAARNGWMLHILVPDLVVAFPGGLGTANAVEQAMRRGIEVRVVE